MLGLEVPKQVQAVNQGQLLLMLCLVSLSNRHRARCGLILLVLKEFRKIWSMIQDKPIMWKSHWKQLGWAWKLGWAGPQGITRVGQIVWGRLMESQIWCPPAVSMRGGLRKGTTISASTSVWEKAAPQLSAWCWTIQLLPPLLSLMSFNLPPFCWSSDWVSPSTSVHGPFKSKCQGVQQLLSSTASIPTGFYSQKLWRLIFLVLKPWVGGPGVTLGPLTPDISLLIFICHTWLWN